MVTVRPEGPDDAERIHRVVHAAFGQPAEADLVDRIRARGKVIRSLVAQESGVIVGHLLITAIGLDPDPGLNCWAIGPVAVTPERQRQGIGSRLMVVASEEAQSANVDCIFLLGDPAYYVRFGYRLTHIGNDFGVTDAFMALELAPGCLAGLRAVAHYAPEFSDLES